jgi:hypothetical protein
LRTTLKRVSNKNKHKIRTQELELLSMKTLKEARIEIAEIVNNYHLSEDRLQKLQEAGYTIDYNWVKGRIGDIFYLQRLKGYRIQITASELHGKYRKAWCVVIPSEVPDPNNHAMSIFTDYEIF